MSVKGFKIEDNVVRYDYNALDNKPETDSTLSVEGSAADAKIVGDKINSIISGVTNSSIYDISGASLLKFQILGNGTWSAVSTSTATRCSIVPVPNETCLLTFTASGSGSIVAFLRSDTVPVSGATPDFSTNYQGRIGIDAGTTVTYAIESDMKYIYVLRIDSNNNDRTPTITSATIKSITDGTLTREGIPADAKAVGDNLTQIRGEIPIIDSTLTVSGASADAKIVGDKINSVVNTMTNDNIYDVSSAELLKFQILGNGTWSSVSTASTRCSIVPIPDRASFLTFVAAEGGSIIAFLRSNTVPSSGATPDFSTNYQERIGLNAGSITTYAVESDMKYIYLLRIDSSNTNRTPTIVNISIKTITDDTLTEPGIPADAKATGDNISNLSSVLNDVVKEYLSLDYSTYSNIDDAVTNADVLAGTPANYLVSDAKSKSVTNIPIGNAGRLIVLPQRGTGNLQDGGLQLYITSQTAGQVKVFIRGYKNETWTSWKEFTFNDTLLAVKDELKEDIINLEDFVLDSTVIDLNSIEDSNWIISSNNVWTTSSSGARSILVPLNGAAIVKLVGNASYDCAYTFLITGNHNTGSGNVPDFAGGATERSIASSGETLNLIVPVDANYLYVHKATSSETVMPHALTLLSRSETDLTLSIGGKAADAKVTGDKINSIIDNVLSDSTYDISSALLLKFQILSNGTWSVVSTASTRCSVVPVPADSCSLTFTTGTSGAIIAFLNSYVTPASGDTPDFSANYQGRIGIDAGSSATYAVESDMKYIYILRIDSSSTDRTPTIVSTALNMKTDASFTKANVPADSAAVGKAISALQRTMYSFCYSSLVSSGETWWTTTGKHMSDGTSPTHLCSTLVKINPGETLYFGYNHPSSCVGAFFDEKMQMIAPLLKIDVEEYSYRLPDGSGRFPLAYVKLYRTVANAVPSNAQFYSHNLAAAGADYKYREFVSNKPMYALNGSGNIVVPEYDPIAYAKGSKKLCVIGPSTAMIDRMNRKMNPDDDNSYQYVVGWQEYLMPFYESVETYGYSGAGWAKGDNVNRYSIYSYITGDDGSTESPTPLDLSGYDEYIIMSSGNYSATTTIGNYDSTDVTTYFGGLNAVIKLILTQNPDAKIYLMNTMRGSADPAKIAFNSEINEKTAQLSDSMGLELIDRASGSAFNTYTASGWTYDGSHYNQKGSKVLGLFVRKAVCGI